MFKLGFSIIQLTEIDKVIDEIDKMIEIDKYINKEINSYIYI